jgi:macrodomain Ter protein organizer (MatP/YcbG family)
MDSKLTLKLDKEIIERAKEYAKNKNTSLSKLIENMLSRVTSSSNFETQITPLVDSLSGIIDSDKINIEDYRDYLEEKYK